MFISEHIELHSIVYAIKRCTIFLKNYLMQQKKASLPFLEEIKFSECFGLITAKVENVVKEMNHSWIISFAVDEAFSHFDSSTNRISSN